MDTREESVKTMAELSGVKARTLQRGYKQHNPDYQQWDQRKHAKDWLVFPQPIGPHLAIDEVSLSQGKLYTFVINKAGKGKTNTIEACIRGTQSADIVRVLNRISLHARLQVTEVSVDMAKNMESAIRSCFPAANPVTDRFRFALLRIMSWRWLTGSYNYSAHSCGKPVWKKKTEPSNRLVNKVNPMKVSSWPMVTRPNNSLFALATLYSNPKKTGQGINMCECSCSLYAILR